MWTDQRLLLVGCWLLVVSCWLCDVCHLLFVRCCSRVVFRYLFRVVLCLVCIGCVLCLRGCGPLVVCSWLLCVARWLTFVVCWLWFVVGCAVCVVCLVVIVGG